jgi:hypothetical protein
VDANAPYAATFFQKFSDDGRKLDPLRRVTVVLPPPFPNETHPARLGMSVPLAK